MTPISPETRQFINEHQSDDVRNLALQARKYPDVDIPAAITQIACLLYTSDAADD